MRVALRSFTAAAITLLAACGSITDPSGPGAPGSALAARKPPRPARTPILFVHGFNSSASVWTTMIGRFKRDGWLDSELASFSYNTAASNATTAAIISQKVDSIRQAKGVSQVAIVGHSMGTLSARYYTRNLGGDLKVSALPTDVVQGDGARFDVPQCTQRNGRDVGCTAVRRLVVAVRRGDQPSR
jgi:triacylglycerol lipase